MPAALELKDPVASRAVEWMVLLRSGNATARDVAEFERWRCADPSHEAACQRIERVLGGFASCSADPAARNALLKPATRRRAIGSLLGLAGAGVVAGWTAHEGIPGKMLADLRTGTGKRQHLTLADGSTLLLNARSSLDLTQVYSGAVLDLLVGEVMVRGAFGGVAVRGGPGRVIGREAEFAVRISANGMRVAVLHGSVSLQPSAGPERTLQAGGLAWMDSRSVVPLTGLSAAAETAWVDGLLQVSNRPLAEVVAALGDYRPGVIRIDDAAAALRISGVFPLDDTDRALRAIAQTMPVRVRMTTPYWVSIQAV